MPDMCLKHFAEVVNQSVQTSRKPKKRKGPSDLSIGQQAADMAERYAPQPTKR